MILDLAESLVFFVLVALGLEVRIFGACINRMSQLLAAHAPPLLKQLSRVSIIAQILLLILLGLMLAEFAARCLVGRLSAAPPHFAGPL